MAASGGVSDVVVCQLVGVYLFQLRTAVSVIQELTCEVGSRLRAPR